MVREAIWFSRELEMKDGTIAPASFYLTEGDGYPVKWVKWWFLLPEVPMKKGGAA